MKWIKCTEQMPELDKQVILLIEDRVYVGCLNFSPASYINRKGKKILDKPELFYFTTEEYDSCCRGNDPRLDQVTHWMHLPEKPKSIINCQNCKNIGRIFDCCWGSQKGHLKDEQCDDYRFRSKCVPGCINER